MNEHVAPAIDPATKIGGEHWWIYECSPIDWWWGWMPAKDWLDLDHYANDKEKRLNLLLDVVVATRRYTPWEGDGNWRIAPLPEPDGEWNVPMFAIKQSNNGTTFIVSPRRLPWLDEFACRGEFGGE